MEGLMYENASHLRCQRDFEHILDVNDCISTSYDIQICVCFAVHLLHTLSQCVGISKLLPGSAQLCFLYPLRGIEISP